MTANSFRYDIEGLRGLAVLLVVLFHLDFNFVSGGFVGVDVFFVISGYLITNNIIFSSEKGSFSIKLFYYKRGRRLLPALYAVIISSLIFGFIVLNPLEFVNLAKSAIYSVLSIANIFFWQDGSEYFNSVSTIKPLLNIWSLGVEEQFYLFWPLALVLILKISNHTKRLFIIVFFIILFAIITALVTINHQNSAFYLMPFRISEFLLGALIAVASKSSIGRLDRINTLYLKEIFFAIGICAITYAALKFTKSSPFPGYYVLLPTIGASFLIWSGDNKYTSILLKNKFMILLGGGSYSIYLWHWPLIEYYRCMVLDELKMMDKLLLLFMSLIIGILSYRYIETLFYKKNNYQAKTKVSKSFLAFITICALSLIAVSGSIIINNGYPSRASSEYLELIENPAKYHIEYFGGSNQPLSGKIGDSNGTIKAIVVGDSFAHHLAAGFDNELKGKKEYVEVLFQHGCLFSPIAYIAEGDKEKCREHILELKRIVKNNKNTPIIIAESWLHYPGILLDSNKTKIDISSNYTFEEFNENNFDALREFLGSDNKIFIVGNPAGSGSQDGVIGCLSRPEFMNSSCKNKLFFDINTGAGYEFNLFLKEYANKHKNTYYIDLYGAFCKSGKCTALDEKAKIIYYSDGGHFSKDGSKIAVKYLLKQFDDTIKGAE